MTRDNVKPSSKMIVDLQKLADLNSGLGQFSWHLTHELLQIDPSVELYMPEVCWDSFTEAKRHRQKSWHRYWSGCVPRGDLFHSLHQEAPFHSRSKKVILTIHDLNYILEDRPNSAKKRWLRKVQKKIDQASAIAYISNYAKDLTHEKLETQGKLEKVIYNGVAIREDLKAESPSNAPTAPFFFSIGTVVAKKSFHTLIEAMRFLPDYKMYLAGWKDNSYAREMAEKIESLGLSDRFFLIGKISEAEKNWFYQNCEGVLFPSLQEGFGLPVVEAMHFGCPVFISRYCALPEIGGEVAFYFDSFEAESMAQTVSNRLAWCKENPGHKEKLKARAAQFSWKKAAQEYYKFYQEVLQEA